MKPNHERLIERLCRCLHRAGVFAAIPLLVAVLGADVLLRYVFNAPLIWGDETSALVLLIVFFASLPQVTQNRGHVQMDMLYKVMPAFLRQVCDGLSGVCGLIFSGLLLYQSFKSTVDMYRWNERAEMIAIPYWPLALFAALCGLVLCLQFALQILAAFRAPAAKGKD
jgi:TRAP-type C4-dicarboxylate transport system permease small subunit